MNAPLSSQVKNKRRQQAYQRGKWAEYLAATWLIFKGYRIISLRYKTIHGEIDLIARRGNMIIFVEVKTRKTIDIAKQSVTIKQRQRIANAATQFLKTRPRLARYTTRYDIIAIMPHKLPQHVKAAW